MVRTINFESNQNGKNVLFISGVHGNEVGAIKLSFMLYEHYLYCSRYSTDIPKGISSISFIHVANKEGVRRCTRDMVWDPNLNNSFNDDVDTKKEILNEIEKNDYIIDLHCSPYSANTFLLENDLKSFLIKEFIDRRLDIETTLRNSVPNYIVRNTNINSIKTFVNKKYPNKFAFTWEQLGMDRNSLKSINHVVSTDSINILIYFISHIHELEMRQEEDFDIPMCHVISTPVEGYLTYTHELGSYVRKDNVIVYIKDLNTGNIIHTIKAPCNCKFLIGNNNLYVNSFDFVAAVQPWTK